MAVSFVNIISFSRYFF